MGDLALESSRLSLESLIELRELTLGDLFPSSESESTIFFEALFLVETSCSSSSDESIEFCLFLDSFELIEASVSSSVVAALILCIEGCVGSSTPSSEELSIEFCLFFGILVSVGTVSSAEDSARILSLDG